MTVKKRFRCHTQKKRDRQTHSLDEWGNPNNKEYYEYMLSYSPYDNVEAKEYTNLLVTTGLHDSQVQYFQDLSFPEYFPTFGERDKVFESGM